MEIKIDRKTYEVIEYNSLRLRLKSLRFVFEPLNFIIKLPNKKVANTYFFVQRIDVCFTDKRNRIIKLYENVNSEKLIFELSATHLYYLPLGCAKEFRVGDILK